MEKLSKTEAEPKKSVAYKKNRVVKEYSIETESLQQRKFCTLPDQSDCRYFVS